MSIENVPSENESTASEDADGLNRREIARKAGKFLAYTAPALIALITAKNASAS
jgi:hypothetical protein